MQPLNPALLDNNGFTNNSKKQFNKTIKNQKHISNNIDDHKENSVNNTVSSFEKNNNIDNSDKLTKITKVNDVIQSIFNQNNEEINSSTIFDINRNNNVKISNKDINDSDNSKIGNIGNNSNSYLEENSNFNYYNKESGRPNIDSKKNSTNVSNFSKINGENIIESKNKNDELLEKLNYVIYLLEDQRGQKSNYVTEEIILYIFLGIFIIFVIDKFSRPNKYVR